MGIQKARRSMIVKKIQQFGKKAYRFSCLSKLFFAEIIFILSDRKDRSIVLIGEKNGLEARDNAFEFYKYCMERGDKKFFYIINRKSKDKKLVDIYDNVIIKNSLKHYIYSFRCRCVILNDGYLDVYPHHGEFIRRFRDPIVYLQHGIVRYKRIYFSRNHYAGRIIAFIASLKSEKEIITNEMFSKSDQNYIEQMNFYKKYYKQKYLIYNKKGLSKFSSYLSNLVDDENLNSKFKDITRHKVINIDRIIKDGGFDGVHVPLLGLPRHDIIFEKKLSSNTEARQVFYFPTWRDYWPSRISINEFEQSMAYEVIMSLVKSEMLESFLKKNDMILTVCLHEKMNQYSKFFKDAENNRIRFDFSSSSIRRALEESKVFITDYSSLAFDFYLSKVPVVFYQPDRDKYEEYRGSYCHKESQWLGEVTENIEQLLSSMNKIINSHEEIAESNFETIRKDYPNYGSSNRSIYNFVDEMKPNVTFLCYNIFGIGGTVSTTINMANYLYQQGYPVDIISLRRTSKFTSLGLNSAISVKSMLDFTNGGAAGLKIYEKILRRIPSILFSKSEDNYGGASILTDIRLMYYIRRCTSEVTISTLPSFARALLIFGRRRSKIIAQEHKFFASHKPELQKLIRKFYRKCDAVTVLTQADSDEYTALLGGEAHVLPNGVFEPYIENDGVQRYKVVSFGRLVPMKQFDVLIKAFALAVNKSSKWTLSIYGDGPEKTKLARLIQELQMEDRIFLEGNVLGSGDVLMKSDICAVASTYEGFGMTFIEAYAARVPVVTFDIERGPKEIVIDGLTGLKAEPFDLESYSSCLSRLMRSKSLRRKMGNNGYNLFKEKYQISKTGAVLENIISECISRK